MNHDELRELIPAYALAALDADERRALETHLSGCDECRTLLADYYRLGDDLLYAAPPVAAPPGLTEDLRRRIAPPQVERVPRFSLASLFIRPTLGLALAGIALLLLVSTNLYWYARTTRIERDAAAVTALTQASPIILTASEDARGRGVFYWPPEKDVALLCVWGLQALPEEQEYQVWLVSGEERVSGGTFRVTDEGYGILFLRPPDPLPAYDGVGITVEPAGGSPGPTSPRLLGAAF